MAPKKPFLHSVPTNTLPRAPQNQAAKSRRGVPHASTLGFGLPEAFVETNPSIPKATWEA